MPAGPMMTATKLPEIVGVTQLLAESELALTLCGSGASGVEDALGLAEVALAKRQVPSNDRQSVLRTARNALRKIEPELRRELGFAVFAKMSSAGGLILPQPVPNLAVVGARFYIKPILGLLDRKPTFYVLAIGGGKARLLSCDQYAWVEVSLGPPDEQGEDEPAYLGRVAAAVDARLAADGAPLVLVAEPARLDRLRRGGGLSRAIEPGVALDPEELDDAELHRRALALVLAKTGSPKEQVLEQIRTRLNAGDITAAIKPDQIVTAALHGRIDAAVVAIDETLWGTVQASGSRVSAPGKPSRQDEELLNLIVVETLKRGGQAFAVPHEAMPSQALAAALLRY
jgi:hypothetical protein